MLSLDSFRSTLSGFRRAGQRCALLAFSLAAVVTGSQAASLPTGFTESQVATGLRQPTAMAFAPDGRLFVCEQGGALRVIKNGSLLSAPFLSVTVSSSGERGLLGIAFDPNFETNHFVYVYYTATTPAIHNRLSRFVANGDVAVGGSETQLLNLPNLSATNHNGGALHFGNDGKLYIGVGENAVGSNAQSTNTILGKILRINADASIPSDNPFFNSTTGNNRMIWAMGLRNPFTFAFDRTNGTLFINDVGQNTWEEINRGRAGANYGWPTTEGATNDSRFVGPIYTYNHSSGTCSIVGGTFYRPETQQFPSLYTGKYFFGDYCAGWIRMLDPSNATATTFATGISSLVDLRVSTDGSLYYLSRGANSTSGMVSRIRFSQSPAISAHPQSQTVSAGQAVTFSVTANGTAPLSYQWQRNDVNIAGATSSTLAITAGTGDNGATYRVIVTNGSGTATSNRATLTVNATANPNAPTATITEPTEGTLFSGGQVIRFAGTASDVEDGVLGASSFTWEVVLHHDTHVHPFFGPTSGITSGSVTIPTEGETSSNIFYRIHLRVTDSGGKTTEVTRDILPRKVDLTFATNPAGLTLTLDGQPLTTPATVSSVVGMTRTIGVVSPQSANGQSWGFQSWSDGGAATHNISTPSAPTTYTATFTAGANPTSIVMEAETLARTATGATADVAAEAAASAGAWAFLAADSTGDFIEFTTPSVPAGTYELLFKYKTNTNRGQHTVQVDGAQVGSTIDQYLTNATYPEVSLGSVVFASAGTHRIRLTVTGRNAASADFRITADRFTLSAGTGSGPAQVFEGESALISPGAPEATNAGFTGSGYANTDNVLGAFVEWTVDVSTAGTYTLDFRHANGSASARTADLRVNGALVQAGVAFPVTGAFTTWADVNVSAPLAAGTNKVRLTATTANGCNNLDKLTLSQ